MSFRSYQRDENCCSKLSGCEPSAGAGTAGLGRHCDSRLGIGPTEFVAATTKRHLSLRTDDVVTETRNKRLPTVTYLQESLKFAASSENLLVSCRAGRSPCVAVAFRIAFRRLGPAAGLSLLNPKRHSPHALVVKLGERLVNDPTLLTAFNDWRERHQGIRLSNYVDDIEIEFDKFEQMGAKNRHVRLR